MSDDEQKIQFQEWLNGRPEIIQDLGNRFPPWNVYRNKKTGKHYQMYSYEEDGTVTASVIGGDNELQSALADMFPCKVFGIDPTELEVLTTNKG